MPAAGAKKSCLHPLIILIEMPPLTEAGWSSDTTHTCSEAVFWKSVLAMHSSFLLLLAPRTV
eukprot:4922393-Amphidinium_carterae.1